MLGVNLSGAEFGKGTRYGYDYIYPSAKDIETYAQHGMTLVRLPVRWERLQPELGGDIDQLELGRLHTFLAHAAKADIKVILDVHNYARYAGKIIGSADVPMATFADFWSKLADAVGDSTAIYGYGLMNEPHGMPNKAVWPQAAQAATDAIRALGDDHAIFVSGEHWGNATNWAAKNPMLDVKDPLDNIVYEAHVYFDRDSSGTYKGSYDQEGATADIGARRIQGFIDWLAEKGHKGFIGEFGVPSDDPRWQVVLSNFLETLNENGLSGTYWGAGPWFGGYKLGLLDKQGKPTAAFETLVKHVADGADVGVGSEVPMANAAPNAVDETFTVKHGASVVGNVLMNDNDPDGDALIANVKQEPANGTLRLEANGDFVYTPKPGFSGVDQFIYFASDGKDTDAATVTLDVLGPLLPPGVTGDLVARAGTIDGSAATNQTLVGQKGANTFFFEAGKTGNDRIINFEKNDVLAFENALFDGNKDGLITFKGNTLSIDAPKVGDMLRIDGVSALRLIGRDDAGNVIYADASVRPKGAKESTLADNVLSGDKGDKRKDVFFFDTALGADLGNDVINLFGNRDLIVTTTRMVSIADSDTVKSTDGKFELPNGLGSIKLKGGDGAAISAVEYDGAVVRGNVTYFVYSLTGSAADAADMTF